jgi:hypothetical protein
MADEGGVVTIVIYTGSDGEESDKRGNSNGMTKTWSAMKMAMLQAVLRKIRRAERMKTVRKKTGTLLLSAIPQELQSNASPAYDP